jgi:hypothetical protein
MKIILCYIFLLLQTLHASLFDVPQRVSSGENEEVQSFALKIATVDENSPVTCDDFSLFEKFGFKAIKIAFCGFPFVEGETSTTWKEIFTFCKRVETSATLHNVIACVSNINNANKLKRENFLSLYNLFTFLKADSSTFQSYKSLKFLSRQRFTASVKNSVLAELSECIRFSNSSITMNFANVYLKMKSDPIYATIVKDIFSFYSKKTDLMQFLCKLFGIKSFHLKRISIKNLPSNEIYDAHLGKMIESHSKSIGFLCLSNVECNFLRSETFIQFPAVKNLEIRASKLHSTRTNWIFAVRNDLIRFNVDFPVEEVTYLGEFHLMQSLCDDTSKNLNHFIKKNPNLKSLSYHWNQGKNPQDSIKSLASLEFLQIKLDAPLESLLHENCAKTLNTLIIHSSEEYFDWNSLLSLDNLIHLEFISSNISINQDFFDFCIEAKDLQILSLPESHLNNYQNGEFFAVINNLTSLKVLAFKVDAHDDNSSLSLDHIEGLFLQVSGLGSMIYLPSGKAIKYLQLNFDEASTEQPDMALLKKRFPCLEKVKIIGVQSENVEITNNANFPIYPCLLINQRVF